MLATFSIEAVYKQASVCNEAATTAAIAEGRWFGFQLGDLCKGPLAGRPEPRAHRQPAQLAIRMAQKRMALIKSLVHHELIQ